MGNEYQHRLIHYGIKGQKWGVRRFETEDGHLTEAGKDRYLDAVSKISRKQDRVQKKIDRNEKKREKYDKLRAKHERKLGRNYISRRFLLSKRYHAWRHEINGVKQEKYRRKVERGKRKFERYQKKLNELKNLNHSASFDEMLEVFDTLTEEQKEFFYYLFDDVYSDGVEDDEDLDEEFDDDLESDSESDTESDQSDSAQTTSTGY